MRREWKTKPKRRTLAACLFLQGWLTMSSASAVDFSTEIKPVLSDNCFQCHGPDANHRKAGLRLDTSAGMLSDLGGYQAVVPGDPSMSELWNRISTKDPKDVMPPVKSGKSLTNDQIQLIRQWILEGAAWSEHWSFKPIVRPDMPDTLEDPWVQNPIDAFVLSRLKKEGLEPTPRAEAGKLMRRLSLSLTGLPPSLEEIHAYRETDSPQAYRDKAESLLGSTKYGEHMARFWLDAARYGDTHGLHLDNERSIWPYRDWVVGAFQQNLPFDRFTVYQIAGDMLPMAGRDQLVATGFNRCNVTTSEGGAIPEEFAVRYAIDRVSTMSTVWMGLTAGCAQCHDHKFDPITQKEFYSLFAFYNNLDENPMDGNAFLYPPTLRLDSPEDTEYLSAKDSQIEKVEKAIRLNLAAAEYKDPWEGSAYEQLVPVDFVWVEDQVPSGAKLSDPKDSWQFLYDYEAPVYSGKTSHAGQTQGKGQHFFEAASHPLRIGKGDLLFSHVYLDPLNPPKSIMLQFHAKGNWNHRAYWGEDLIDYGSGDGPEHRHMGDLPEPGRWVRLEVPADQVGLKPGDRVDGLAFAQFDGRVFWDASGIRSRQPQAETGFESLTAWLGFLSEQENPDLPPHLKEMLEADRKELPADRQRLLREYFIEHVWDGMRDVFDPLHQRIQSLQSEKREYEKTIPRTLVTRELPEPRNTFVLNRGEYDKPGEPVTAALPAFLPPLPEGQKYDRLGLANWLTDPKHPLTARVIVNRFWQQHFGVGIVATSEDFGAQGDSPSHPDLLDWLAAEFMESGWDVAHIQRLIVTSATFQQSSDVNPALLKRDPANRLLARGPKFRLDAEVLRDNALALSGLLVRKTGGRGVKPYQPAGLWEAVAYPSSTTAKFVQDTDEALYRRSLYTFWKRTSPPPSMTAFDAPTREACIVRRERTNTPLQALVMLNDVQFTEAARHFAGRILREGGDSPDSRFRFAFKSATGRDPDVSEQAIMKRTYEKHEAYFRENKTASSELVHYGDSALFPGAKVEELAAWTLIANLILNLDEAITLN